MSQSFQTYWTLYFHHPSDNNWGIQSYKKIGEIRTPTDFWNILDYMGNDIIENSMLFFMKEDLPPLWEDSRNIKGGSWSFKIYTKNVAKVWAALCSYIVSHELTTDNEKETKITGLTISPKRSFSIIKIWNDDASKQTTELLRSDIPHINLEESIYKPHDQR
jgi:hypothetical protein